MVSGEKDRCVTNVMFALKKLTEIGVDTQGDAIRVRWTCRTNGVEQFGKKTETLE